MKKRFIPKKRVERTPHNIVFEKPVFEIVKSESKKLNLSTSGYINEVLKDNLGMN